MITRDWQNERLITLITLPIIFKPSYASLRLYWIACRCPDEKLAPLLIPSPAILNTLLEMV